MIIMIIPEECVENVMNIELFRFSWFCFVFENCSVSIWKEEKINTIAFGVLSSVFFVVSLVPYIYDTNDMCTKVIFDSLIVEIFINFGLEC